MTSLPPGWSAERRYYNRGRRETTPAPTEKELYSLLNAGIGLVVHAGHGDSDRWHGCCTTVGIKSVRNSDRLPVMVSAGCSTAHFAPLPPYEAYTDIDGVDHPGTNAGESFTAPPPPPAAYQRRFNPTGLGEELLRKGQDVAVAYIGCNTGSQPCGLTLVEGFGLALGQSDEPRLGDLWSSAIHRYHRKERLAELTPDNGWYPPSIFFQGMKFMLFGDPTLPLP